MWDKTFRDQYMLIEVTDFCNLNCIMCCHDKRPGPHDHKQGFMKLELFKKIIDEYEYKDYPAALKLFWLGEPFLNPQFSDMLEYAYNKINFDGCNEYIDLHTNGHFLNDKMIALLIKFSNKIPRLTISLDAIKPDTYKKIRRGGNLDRVIKNIENFLNKREELKCIAPTLIFQFIVMDENHEETLEFIEFWKNKIISLKKHYMNKWDETKQILSNLTNDLATDVIWIKRVDVCVEKRAHAEKLYKDTLNKFKIKPEKNRFIEIVASVDNVWDEMRY